MVFSVSYSLKYFCSGREVQRYQLDLTTPGNRPSEASFRKQIRQIPNFLIYALGRPQIGQRLYARTLNLGFRTAFIFNAVLANVSSFSKSRTPGLPVGVMR